MDTAFAIADPVRRDILMLVKERSMSAGEIADCFEISRPAISRHLRVLREAGLVSAAIEGRQWFYTLDTSPLEPLAAWLAGLSGTSWSSALDALETEVYRTRRERRGVRTTFKEKSA